MQYIAHCTHECSIRVARKQGVRKRSEYNSRDFTHPQLCDFWSKWHQTYSGCALHLGRPHSKFEEDSFRDTSNQTFEKNSSLFLLILLFLFAHCYSSRTCALMWLKFDARIGGLKVNQWQIQDFWKGVSALGKEVCLKNGNSRPAGANKLGG